MKKRFLAIPLSILLAACSFTSFAAGLVQNGDNVQYESNDGTLLFDKFQKIDGSYYYFDDNGNMAKDCLVEYESNKYYLGKDGKKLTDAWVKIQEKDNKDPYWFYFDDKGRAKEEGWLTWKGKKYHFTNYHMDYGWFMDEEGDEYYLNGPDDGHMETGWLPYTEDEEIDPEGKHRTGWYYFLTPSGKMVKSTEKKIVSKYYAFGEDGLMIDGFGYVENYNNLSDADKFVVKYYDKITGVRADGWRYIQGEDDEDAAVKREDGWYYFKNGEAYTAYSDTKLINLETGIRKIGADYYAFDTTGKMLKGLIQAQTDDSFNGRYYYFGEDGRMKTGYVKVEDLEDSVPAPEEYMYFNPKGVSIPNHGATVTGEVGNRLYENGILIKAEKDSYELYTLSTGKTYIVSEKGTFIKSGTVKLYSGKKMKISYDGSNYSWEPVK